MWVRSQICIRLWDLIVIRPVGCASSVSYLSCAFVISKVLSPVFTAFWAVVCGLFPMSFRTWFGQCRLSVRCARSLILLRLFLQSIRAYALIICWPRGAKCKLCHEHFCFLLLSPPIFSLIAIMYCSVCCCFPSLIYSLSLLLGNLTPLWHPRRKPPLNGGRVDPRLPFGLHCSAGLEQSQRPGCAVVVLW